jgi:hypothetical protein
MKRLVGACSSALLAAWLARWLHAPLPIGIPRSAFPGYPGFATGAIGFASAELDDPSEEIYTLEPSSEVEARLTFVDAGVAIHDGILPLSVGQSMHFGNPFFDYHPIWTIPSPAGPPDGPFRLRFVFHDASGLYADSDEFEVTLVRGCHADLDDGTGSGAGDGGVDINDLLARYELGNFRADLDDGSGTGASDGGVDVNDLLFFLAHYESGC